MPSVGAFVLVLALLYLAFAVAATVLKELRFQRRTDCLLLAAAIAAALFAMVVGAVLRH
jgi:hypothetical protein